VCQRRRQIAFPAAGRPRDEEIFVFLNPARLLRQAADYALIDSPVCPVIDIFYARVAAQPGSFEPLLKGQILAPGVLTVHDQRQFLLKREIARRFILFDGFQAVHHTLQAHGDELFNGRLVQHRFLPYS
jgi:hypothetical protein